MSVKLDVPSTKESTSGLSVMYSSRTRSSSRLSAIRYSPRSRVETLGLICDRAVEGGELLPGSGELSLEHRETRLLRVDTCLQLAHPTRDGAQLLGEDAGPPPGILRLAAQSAELAVDAGLLRARVARRGARREEEAKGREAGDSCLEAGSTTHQALFALPAEVPSPPPVEPVERPERLGRVPPQHADDPAIVVVRDPPRPVVGLELSQRRQRPITRLLRREALSLGGAELEERVGLGRRLAQERECDHDDDRDDERRAQQEPHAHVVAGVSRVSPTGA